MAGAQLLGNCLLNLICPTILIFLWSNINVRSGNFSRFRRSYSSADDKFGIPDYSYLDDVDEYEYYDKTEHQESGETPKEGSGFEDEFRCGNGECVSKYLVCGMLMLMPGPVSSMFANIKY